MFATEVLARAVQALSGAGTSWLAVLTLGSAAVLPQTRRLAQRPALARAGLALALVLGVAWAWSLAWASDDAYISFRYARHLAQGHGLVFNIGERVEGYTDFLWTLLIAGLVRLGAPAGESAILLSLFAFAALILAVWRLAERLSPAGTRTLPVAALLTAGNYTLASFATSGLETVLAALFVLGALIAAESRRAVLSGSLVLLASLCHPDHLIFAVGLGGAWALTCRSVRELSGMALRFSAPFLVLFVPYFLWRWHYYGDLLPNTYYAKSAGLAYFRRGGVYLIVSALTGGACAALPLAAWGAARSRRSITGGFAILAVPLYLLYVAKIGGDFMVGRLCVPVLPVLFVLAEVAFRTLLLARPSLRNTGRALSLGLLTSIAGLPLRIVAPEEVFHGIADERTFTPLSQFSPLATEARGYRLGRALHDEFRARGLEPKLAIYSIGMAGYFSELPIYDLRGLTSRDVAHLPIATRGRPGHEKLASPGMVLDSGALLSEASVYPPPYDELGRAEVAGFPFAVVRFEPMITPTLLERHGVIDYRAYLDEKIPTLAAGRARDPARTACDLWHLRAYYFSVNDDAARRQAVARALAADDPEGAALWEAWLGAAYSGAPSWRRLEAPGSPSGAWRPAGDAASWRVTRTPPRQQALSAQPSPAPFVDSFSEARANASTGELVSPPFVVQADAFTFQIAGGLLPAAAQVDLLIDGETVRSATGCDADVWGARLWDVRRYRGRTATLRIRDSSAEPWGHIAVDSIEAWQAAAPP